MPPHLPPVPSVVSPEELPPATLLWPPLAPPLSGRASSLSSFGRTTSPATSRHAATPLPPGAPPTLLLPVRGQRPHLSSPPPPSGARLSLSFRARWIWTSAPPVGRRSSIHQPEPVQMPDLKFERVLMVIHRRDAWRTSPSTCRFSTGQRKLPLTIFSCTDSYGVCMPSKSMPQSIFFNAVEITLIPIRSVAPTRVLATQPPVVQLRSPGPFNDKAAGCSSTQHPGSCGPRFSTTSGESGEGRLLLRAIPY